MIGSYILRVSLDAHVSIRLQTTSCIKCTMMSSQAQGTLQTRQVGAPRICDDGVIMMIVLNVFVLAPKNPGGQPSLQPGPYDGTPQHTPRCGGAAVQ